MSRQLTGAFALAALLVGCSNSGGAVGSSDSGDRDEVAAAGPVAEPAPPTAQPGERGAQPELDAPPTAADEPSFDHVPPIRDDDPLFEPLPPLEPADDGGLPADEQLEYLELVAAALATEAQLLATGEVDHELLRQTHDGIAFDKVAARVEELAAHGVIERLPDLRYTSIHVRHAGGSHYAIVRSCFEPGPRTGLYDADTREMVAPMGESTFGDERMVWRVPEPGSEQASLRVMDVHGVPPGDCD